MLIFKYMLYYGKIRACFINEGNNFKKNYLLHLFDTSD